MICMLANGGRISLPDPEAVETAIRNFEADLRKLRRLRDVIQDFRTPAEPEKPEPEKPAA